MLKLFKRRHLPGSPRDGVARRLDAANDRGFDALWHSLPRAERRTMDPNTARIFYALGFADGIVYAIEDKTVSECALRVK